MNKPVEQKMIFGLKNFWNTKSKELKHVTNLENWFEEIRAKVIYKFNALFKGKPISISVESKEWAFIVAFFPEKKK